ncbi:perlucin-like protein [Saccostrea echinata]|uniref:perlucin-like protein n=1 Tax=Saccostrea echinata TaxID=191078 RepID=UPI002A83883E|nr:perlucin-like protein [Saccostrea echinata]
MVPSYFSIEYKAIIISTSSVSSALSMSDLPSNSDSTTVFPVEKTFKILHNINSDPVNVWTLSISSGVTKVKTSDGTPFGVIVYGQHSYDGHGFTGNAILSTCKEGWIQIENYCYFISLKRVSFQNALKLCKDENARLTEHQNVRMERLVGLQLNTNGNVGIWIGVTDIQQEGVFVYISDGSRLNNNDNWAEGQPDRGTKYNCVLARKENNWKWYTYPCDQTF